MSDTVFTGSDPVVDSWLSLLGLVVRVSADCFDSSLGVEVEGGLFFEGWFEDSPGQPVQAKENTTKRIVGALESVRLANSLNQKFTDRFSFRHLDRSIFSGDVLVFRVDSHRGG